MATLLAWVPEQQQARYQPIPVAAADGTASHQHHHRARVGGSHAPDQCHLGRRQAQIGAISGGEVASLAS